MNKSTEMSLADVMVVLRRNIWKILAWSVAAALVAGVVSLLMPKAYRARTDLIVLKPTFKQSEASFSELIPETLSARTCDLLLNSAGLIEEVFTKSGARETGNLTVEDFATRLRARIRIEQETNYETVYSPVITLYATAKTPEMAKKIVDTWANLFVEKAKEVQSVETRNVYDFVKNEFEALETSLRDAEEKLRDFTRENNIDRIKIEKEKKELLLTQLQAKAASIAVDIAAAESKLSRLEKEKSQLPTVLPLAKAITDDAMWLTWLEQNRGGEFPQDLKSASLVTQELNPTRLAIEQQIVISQGELGSLQGQQRMTNEKIDEVKTDIEKLQQELAEATMESDRLLRDVGDYTTTHELLVTERDKAKIAAGSTIGDVKIWSPTVLPEKPILPRNKKAVVALAFVIGLVASSAYFLYRDAMTRPESAARAVD